MTIFSKLFLITMLMVLLIPLNVTAHSEQHHIDLKSEAVILMDVKTGDVLYSEKSKSEMYPASLTKVATAIIAIEEGNLSDTVTVSKNARNVEGTRVFLEVGEKVKLKKLVQGLLINSGNDAAIAIAEHLGGSVEAFAKRMNGFLENKVGINDTTFTNPHGLFNPNHVSTAYDLAEMTRYAMQNETFREIFGTKQLEWNGTGWDTTIYNHNQLLWRYDGATGGKTGYVSKSGNTLITTAKRGRTELIAVLLKAPSKDVAYSDTTNLLDYGFKSFETKMIAKTQHFYDDEQQKLYTPKSVYVTVPKGTVLHTEVTVSNELVIKDDKGSVVLDDIKLKEVEKVPKDVETSNEDQNVENKNNKSTNVLPLISMSLSLLLIFAFFILKRLKKIKMKRYES